MFVNKAGVVGAGTMGGEIAYVIAAAGIPVALRDVEQRSLDAALARAERVARRALDGLVASGRLGAEQAQVQLTATLALISPSTGYDGFGDVDFAIEAVPEQIELKQQVLAELDAATPGHAVLASNTSALSISDIATATIRPERVLGVHFFYPAAVMRLVELIEGIDTSAETIAIARSLAGTLRKSAIRVADAPGFVVNRVLISAVGELWRAQQEGGLSIDATDRAVVESKVAPIGPFALADRLGLDTVLHVAEHLHEFYGERMFVHEGMRELVARGEVGTKSGGGFYADGEPREVGGEEPDAAELAERFTLRAFVESCLVLEEGIAGARDIDVGLTAGAGIAAPFAGADAAGLDRLLGRLERAAERWGEAFAPPRILRRLLAQRRTGAASGQGFFAIAAPDRGEDGPVKLQSRGEVAIAWLDNPPANSLSPEAIGALRAIWDRLVDGGEVRALVIASTNPGLFCAGADIKAFTAMDVAGAAHFVGAMHDLLLDMGRSRIATIAAVNGLALGGGCELAMAADVRIAAQSASFGQPEIKLGIMPGFGGTQRLPRLLGTNKALEMNLLGEPIDAAEAWEFGLVNRVVPDHELLDTALAWARALAAQPPRAVQQIKALSSGPELEAGARAEAAAFAEVFGSADAREGIAAFLGRRPPRFTGR